MLVKVKNSMQITSYLLVCSSGKEFDERFKPELSPKQMLTLGVFEGKYLNDTQQEYPTSWFTKAKLSQVPDPRINAFKKKSRSPLSLWASNGWIAEQDPRGWFEWYCRYYQGRRSPDDDRQIKRWRAFVRHSAQVVKHGAGKPSNRPVQRQALLQWSYDPFPDVRARADETVFDKIQRKLTQIKSL
jgi:hypothetical protein